MNWKHLLSKEYVISFEYISLTSIFTKIMDMRQIVKSCLTIVMLFFITTMYAQTNKAVFLISNSNQNCNYSILRIPIKEFRYIDNREVCIYCRSNYIPYSKVDISASLKREVLIDYMFDLIDEHCENLGADNNHKAVHIEQVMNYFLKRGDYTDRADFAREIVKHYNIFQSRNPNPMSIKLYDNNNTRFCSREHEDRYNRRY